LQEEDGAPAEGTLAVALELGCAPFYCFYLVATIRRDAVLVTADKRLVDCLASTPYRSRVANLSDRT
jgi:predicted nucleic acid-binding protein